MTIAWATAGAALGGDSSSGDRAVVVQFPQGALVALIDGLGRIGWEIPKPKGSMFVWAPIPAAYSDMDSVEFCSHVVRECEVALSPGVGFGPGGEGFARFALIENEHRIAQGIRNLKKGLPKLG